MNDRFYTALRYAKEINVKNQNVNLLTHCNNKISLTLFRTNKTYLSHFFPFKTKFLQNPIILKYF